MKTVIYNGEVHLADRVIKNGYIVVDNGKISKIRDLSEANLDQGELEALAKAENADQIINATGKIVAPGSIEMHTHGFAGKEFLDTTPGTLEEILNAYPRFGVTSVSPTIVTDSKENIKRAVENLGKTDESVKVERARLVGCYLECRYFNDGPTKGAHNSKELVNDSRTYKEKYGLVNDQRTLYEIILGEIAEFNSAARTFIKVVAIDPSIDKAPEIIKTLKNKGYKIAIGHSNCTKAQAREAIRKGATVLVHAFNCISMDKEYLGDRIKENLDVKNALGECLDTNGLYAEIILDFVHVNKPYDDMLMNRKGIDYTVLITDACAAAGTQEKECTLGGKRVLIREKNGHKAAYYEDETLCGSVLTMDQAIRNAVELGCSLNESFRMASLNPAKALGIDNERGSISPNKFGDVVIYERGYTENKETGLISNNTIGRTLCTLVEGNIAYSSADFQDYIERRSK